jgi:hypothetical protein
MKKEFKTLSEEERLFLKKCFWKKEEDIKQFIKDILRDCVLIRSKWDRNQMRKIIKKRAGEDLI